MDKWTWAEVLADFKALTGIEFRFLGEEVKRHAQTFAEHFTREELELVILWTRKKIAEQAAGLSAASLQWRVLMGVRGCGDEFGKFQERLGLAREEMKRTGWRPRFTLCAATMPGPVKKPVAVPVSAEEQARIAESVNAQARQARQALLGGGLC